MRKVFKKSNESPDEEEKTNKKVEEIYQAAKDHDIPRLKKYVKDINIKSVNCKEIDNCKIDGGTPLHYACANGEVDAVQQLLCHGANPFTLQHEKEGQAPVHFAAEENNLDCIIALWRQHPNAINFASHSDMLALHIAASKRQFNMILWLINHGTKINHQDHDGNTALHYAAQYGFEDCISILLANGADPKIQNHLGDSCIVVAKNANFIAISNILEKNADKVQNKKQETNGEYARPRYSSVLRPKIKGDLRDIKLKDAIEGDIIEKNFSWICDILNPVATANQLYRKEGLTEDEVEEIIHESTQRERTAKLLNVLMIKPYKNFYVFIKVLKAADATHQQLGKQLENAAESKKSQLKVNHAACSIL